MVGTICMESSCCATKPWPFPCSHTLKKKISTHGGKADEATRTHSPIRRRGDTSVPGGRVQDPLGEERERGVHSGQAMREARDTRLTEPASSNNLRLALGSGKFKPPWEYGLSSYSNIFHVWPTSDCIRGGKREDVPGSHCKLNGASL